MANQPLRVAVIIGSTRKGRVGECVAHWFVAQARRRADVEATVVDLAKFDFPASYPDVATPAMRAFTGALAKAEAFVIVTPEYNRSFPASLKQAIDFTYDEWQAKPVGFVSYGCGSLGTYAIEQLRTVFTELQAMTLRNTVGFDLLDGGFDAHRSRTIRSGHSGPSTACSTSSPGGGARCGTRGPPIHMFRKQEKE